MSTTTVDYEALAKQYGAVKPKSSGPDYDALARKNGGAAQQQTAQAAPEPGFVERLAQSFGIPTSMKELEASAKFQHDTQLSPWALLGPAAPVVRGYVNQVGNAAQNFKDAVIEGGEAYAHNGNLKEMLTRGAGAGMMATVESVPFIGPTIAQAGEDVANRNYKGAAGGTLGVAAQVSLMQPQVAGAVSKVVKAPVEAVRDSYYEARTSAVRGTIPDAANLPPQATHGLEQLNRAAAPVGSDPMFRNNLYRAAGDLAEIGRKIELGEAKGGFIQPDMRPRATVRAINEHLSEMYNAERAPQIARNAQNPVGTQFGVDAQDGLNYLARNAGTNANRALAQRAIEGESITLAEADSLAKLTNKELLGFESMTPAERAAAAQVNRRLSGLKSLDGELSQRIGNELASRGEAGIREYEGRYAALSAVRDQIQTRMNAVELQRSVAPARFLRGVIQGKAGVASASQAAVADVNIGKQLEQGFKNLAASGLQAKRGVSSATSLELRGVPGLDTRVRGLLPQQAGSPFAMPEAPIVGKAVSHLSETLRKRGR